MPAGSAFQELIARVRARDEAAARELLRRYEPAIRRAIRVRLVNRRLRRLLDSMDICQSVFGSFFVRAALGQYELRTPQQLLHLLIDMSRKKLVDHARREGAARRDYRRVEDLARIEKNLCSRGPGPGEQATWQELLDVVRLRLSPEERHLAEQRCDGRDWAQIAAEQGASPEMLRKRLARAVERVAKELELDQ
jgi:RNA polymerase sigma-70 factor (ECF subfamily)